MASSAQEPQPHHPLAPPPTPSTHSDTTPTSTPIDALSHLLHRLPPTLSLSLPTRHRSFPTPPPLISLSDPTALLSASTKLGYFHLTHNPHPPPAAALSLFDLSHSEKQLLFPNNWPLGYDDHHEDDVGSGESFCIDPSCSTNESSSLDLGSLREFGIEMEKLGLKVVEELASAVGFKNPDRDRMCSLLWISDGMNEPGRVYPYVVGLHFLVNCAGNKYSVLSDSGWVSVSDLVDSMLVTLGDICQVWSNGKLKKVRGRPVPNAGNDNNKSHCITMSLLITLPLESMVFPLLPDLAIDSSKEQQNEEINNDSNTINVGEQSMYRSFSFEDYAWRVYHERLHLKDPLVRYRV